MRGQDQTNSRGMRLDWCLFALVALAIPLAVRAQDAPAFDSRFSLKDPITLAADKVWYWSEGGARWVVLEGKAAILSGVEGVRPDRAVVRIRSTDDEGVVTNHLEVYIERNASGPTPSATARRPARLNLATQNKVVIKAYTKGGLLPGKGDPTSVPLVVRGFPDAKPSPAPPIAAQARAATAGGESRVARASDPPGSVANPAQGLPIATRQAPPDNPATGAVSSAALVEPLPITIPASARAQAAGSARAASGYRPTSKSTLDTQVKLARGPGFPDGPMLSPPETDAAPASAAPAQEPSVVVLPPASSDPPKAPPPLEDSRVRPAQAPGQGFGDNPALSLPSDDPFPVSPPAVPPAGPPPAGGDLRAADDPFPPMDGPAPVVQVPDLPGAALPPSDLDDATDKPKRPLGPRTALSPASVRIWGLTSRDGGPKSLQLRAYEAPDGTVTITAVGGVIITSEVPGKGGVDVSCDSAVIWTRNPNGKEMVTDANGQYVQPEREPLEAYLEGNVVLMNDTRKYAGKVDQKTMRSPQVYFDFRTERMIGLDAEMNIFMPGLITPMKIRSPRITQFRPQAFDLDGNPTPGRAWIQADRTSSTGSRFPNPGYRFNSKTMDLYEIGGPPLLNDTGPQVGRNRKKPLPEDDGVYRIDARQNVFFNGSVPIFYWPHLITDSDDLDPVLRMAQVSYVQYFGYQFYTDWSGFKLLGIRKPRYIDNWNVDIDYLSRRGPAGGSEIGWFGKSIPGLVNGPYNGYLELYGIIDNLGYDTLGPGPAVITGEPPSISKNPKFSRSKDPFFDKFRGRLMARHMQSFLDPDVALDDEDFRLMLEASYLSDRNFLEEYYKRLFDSGLDQETDAYLIKQKENRAFTAMASANLQDWYTDPQFFPKLQYQRFGDSFLGGLFNYSTNSGIDYANVHTAVEVNNPNIFAFIPFDPVSNTSGPWTSGRAWTAHELDVPINLDVMRIVPYAQGQLTGWDHQLDGSALGRAWGAVGARGDVSLWRAFPGVEVDILNVHGLAHKIDFTADARFAYSNVNLNTIGIQDTLDDNTYEWSRRYFALTNYFGGVLPPQYDPRFLTLRRAISPIAGTTDVQASIDTIKLGIHQRLQTKRGPIQKRRVIDWMVFDVSTTYFPNAARDNFGTPFGQNTYNWEWYIGDRTSIVSTGWFEFFNITGRPELIANPKHTNDPLQFAVINTGINISKPPRGNIYIGYSVVNTGPIATSALLLSSSYLLSPKWYSTFTTVYDFGNGILLTASGSLTRVGADWLTSIGVSFDPQRGASQFSIELIPRLSPNMRFGSAGGASRFDPRFAPTQ